MKKKLLILFVVSIICLMVGQLTNVWKGSTQREFNRGLTAAGDGYAIGKMALMEQQGTFKNIGALAIIIPHVPLYDEEMLRFRKSFMSSLSYDAYLDDVPIMKHRYYFSRIGMNGFFYGLWNNIFNPDPKAYIQFLYVQKSFLFSVLLSLLILWIAKLTNLYGGVLFLISLIFCPVVTLMGTSLYYVPFAFLIPFLVPVYYLHKEYEGKLEITTKHYFIFGLAFFFNLLFNCFELISTVGILSVIPVFFYGLLSRDLKTTVLRVFKVGFVNIFMCVLTMGLVVTQYKVANHATFSDGLAYVNKKFLTRTTGEKRNNGKLVINEQLVKSQEASYNEVFGMAASSPAIVINGDKKPIAGITFSGLIWIFLIVSILVLVLEKIKKIKIAHSIPILITTWVSILAPLSWFVIFKPHSYLHMHIVVFTWLLPFTIFGFLLIGVLINQLITLKLSSNTQQLA